MRVLVGDPYYSLEDVRELLAGTGAEVELQAAPWDGDDVAALLVSPDQPVGQAEIDRLPRLRVIATCSVGFDHIDIAAATARGVWVCNVPDYCIDEMADSALALLLTLLRGVVVLDRDVRAGGWDYKAAGSLRRIAGTRLGVIGFGRIGRALAVRATALGFYVRATDPVVNPAEIAAAGVGAMPLDELLSTCEAFSLHVPLTPETDGLLGADELAMMPRGSVLVNTARARLVDETALYDALRDGQLAGAALDVLPVEPPKEQPPDLPNLIVNPHSAWYSPEAEEAVCRRPVLSVRTVLEGGEPSDAVTRL